jgi:putative MATE family efflux protein
MDKTWQDREKITGQPIGKALISLAAPAVLSTFFTVVFEIIDMFWIGKLGPDSIAALSGASFFVWMVRGLGLTVATGTIALVSRRTGEKDEQGLLQTISYSIGTAFVFSMLIMILFFPLAVNTFQWLNLESPVAAFAEEYTTVFLSGLIFVYMMMTLEFIIRGIGDTRLPMIITGISLFLNAVLDPIFIFILGMGLKGAAYATILSQGAGTILMAGVLLKKLPALKQVSSTSARDSSFFKIFGRYFYTIVKVGGPVGASDAGFSLIYLFLTGIISAFGKEPLAALGLSHRFEALPFFICLGFSMAVAPMVGQYLGAGDPEKAKKSVYLSLKITSAISFLISVLYFIFAPLLFGFFTNDPAIIRHGAEYIRIVAIFEVFLAFEVVLGGAFSGAGDTRPVFFIVLPATALRVPLAYLFAVVLNLGTLAIWAIIAFTTLIKGTLLFYVFRKGKWARKKI